MAVPPEECVERAETSKEQGTTLFKGGEPGDALAKYREGIELIESLFEQYPDELDADLMERARKVRVALRYNSTLACLQSSAWMAACEHADKVLGDDSVNGKALFCKALYCRGVALSNLDGMLEDAKADFTWVTQLDPNHREAHERLQKVDERIRVEVRERQQEANERLRSDHYAK
eukprot:6616177-Prorocentrum_lima.AAC.1